jgi:putative ABC transport system permease protein
MIGQEIRIAARRLRRAPGFTLACILTLGLGIGGTTAVFSVMRAVVLQPLPFPQPERLVRLYEVTPQGRDFSASEPNFLDFRARLRAMEEFGAFRTTSMTMLGRGDAQELEITLASHGFFSLTGARTAIGRTFAADEDRAGGNSRVIVLSHGAWQRRFGGDRNVVGQKLTIDGDPHEVVGVMASGFDFPEETDGWIPLVAHARAPRGNHMLRTIGRLAPGQTLASAQEEARGVAAALAKEYPVSNGGWSARVGTLTDWLIGPQLRQTMFVLFGAAALLLAVASANVANLVMIRATSRRKELAMLAALGASRSRIARTLLAESLLLALAGGALGVMLAFFGVPAIQQLAPTTVPRLDEAVVDGTVLIVAIAVSVAVGVLFGLMPAFLQTRVSLLDWLRDTTGGAGGASGRRGLRELLVAGELALAMMLLVGAALLVDSFRRLQTVDVGFDPAGVVAVDVGLTSGPYANCIPALVPGCDRAAAIRRRAQFVIEAQERLKTLPGVVAVGATSLSPLSGGGTASEVTIDGFVPRGPDDAPFADWRAVTGGFFKTMGLAMMRGRTFTTTEEVEGGPVVIVSETLARQYWPNENPVGRRLAMGRREQQAKEDVEWLTVIGVARDLRDTTREADPRPVVFLPYGGRSWPFMAIAAKTRGPIDGIAAAIRRDLRTVDPAIPIGDPYPLTRNLDRTMTAPRFSMLLMALFAGVALVLAALGVYGVTAYAVALRTREIGLRMALGAVPRDVLRLIAGRGLILAVLGIVAGSFGAFVLSGFLESLLFQTRPANAGSHALVASVLLMVALVAILIPAWRASRIDPRQALTSE